MQHATGKQYDLLDFGIRRADSGEKVTCGDSHRALGRIFVVMPQGHPGDSFVSNICKHLHETFRVSHATIQVETDPDHPRVLAPDHVI